MKSNVLYIICSYDGIKEYNVKPKSIFQKEHSFYDYEVRDSILNTTLPRLKTWCEYYGVELKIIKKIPSEIQILCDKITALCTEDYNDTNLIKGFNLKVQKSKYWFIKFYILIEFCKSKYNKFLYLDADVFVDEYKDIFSLIEEGLYVKTKLATTTGTHYRYNKKYLDNIIESFIVGNIFGGTSHIKQSLSELIDYDILSKLLKEPKLFLNDEVILTYLFKEYDMLRKFKDEDLGLKFSAGSERIYQYVLKVREQLEFLD